MWGFRFKLVMSLRGAVLDVYVDVGDVDVDANDDDDHHDEDDSWKMMVITMKMKDDDRVDVMMAMYYDEHVDNLDNDIIMLMMLVPLRIWFNGGVFKIVLMESWTDRELNRQMGGSMDRWKAGCIDG